MSDWNPISTIISRKCPNCHRYISAYAASVVNQKPCDCKRDLSPHERAASA